MVKSVNCDLTFKKSSIEIARDKSRSNKSTGFVFFLFCVTTLEMFRKFIAWRTFPLYLRKTGGFHIIRI